MRNDARLDEALTHRIEIDAPRIARSVREHLELPFLRMKTPDARVDLCPLIIGRADRSDLGMSEDAMAAVEPTVRPPQERVQRLVGVFESPAVEQDLRLARRLRRIPVLHLD